MKISSSLLALSTLAIFAPAFCNPVANPALGLPTPTPTSIVEPIKLHRKDVSMVKPLDKRYFQGNPVCGNVASVGGNPGYQRAIFDACQYLRGLGSSPITAAPSTCISLGCETWPGIGSGAVWFCNDLSTTLSWPATGLGDAGNHILQTCVYDSFIKGYWTNTVGFQVFIGSC